MCLQLSGCMDFLYLKWEKETGFMHIARIWIYGW